MSSSNPSFSQFGVDAMSSYFMGSHSGMLGGDLPPFLQGILPPFLQGMPPPDHGGYGRGFSLGDTAAAGATAATEIGAQFVANNLIFASLASQLFAPAPVALGDHLGARTSPEEEMNGGYDVPDGHNPGGGSLVTYPGQSDAHAVALWSLSKKPYGDWSNVDGSRAVTVHGSYQLAEPPQEAGFYFPLAAGHCKAAPSELSPRPASVSMSNATDQFSSGASRSGLTHTNRVEPELPQQVYYPQTRSRPVHFAVVVAGSPYAPLAQQVLNDVVGRLLHDVADDVTADDSASGVGSSSRLSLQASSCSAGAPSVVSCNNQLMASPEEHSHGGNDAGADACVGDAQSISSKLIKMLQLMDQKYNQCLDEIQSMTARFNGLMPPGSSSDGSICAAFAHRAVSATYRALRRRITGEIMAAAATNRPSRRAVDSSMTSGGERERSRESALIQKHLAVQQLRRRREQQCWRPQRGLPEKSVAVLKSWMFENFLRPYPQDSEKDMLAARSGLTRTQVSNWFINARVRLWRPLIEELHEELRRSAGGGWEEEEEEGLAMEHTMSSPYVAG